MSITRNQWFGIANIVLSACMVSTAFFTDTFGATIAKEIVGSAAFLNMIVGGVATLLGGQGQQIRDVAAMPGVDRIQMNAAASPAAAQVAIDPAQTKVGGSTPEAQAALQATAKGS